MTSCRPGVPGGHYWLATGERKDCHELHRCQNCGDTCWLAVTWDQQEVDQRGGKGKRKGFNFRGVLKATPAPPVAALSVPKAKPPDSPSSWERETRKLLEAVEADLNALVAEMPGSEAARAALLAEKEAYEWCLQTRRKGISLGVLGPGKG